MTGVVIPFPCEPAYTAQLHRYLRARLRNRDEVDDVMQEAYLRYLQMPPDRAVQDPQRYLFIIAHNLVKERFKQRARSILKYDSEAIQSCALASPEPDACRDLIAREELALILHRMQPRCREVLLMNKRDGLHYKRIAELLGVAPNTVLNAIGRALMQARQFAGERQ